MLDKVQRVLLALIISQRLRSWGDTLVRPLLRRMGGSAVKNNHIKRPMLRFGILAMLAAVFVVGAGCTPSFLMKVSKRVVKKEKGPIRSVEQLQKEYQGRTYPAPAPISRSLRRLCDIREEKAQGFTVYTLTPKKDASGWHIIYTHGGGFVNEMVGPHWDIIEELIQKTGATVTVPIYPLAPEHEHTKAFSFLEEVYRNVLGTVSANKIILCGDSAGGNLALTQALYFRASGLPLPGRLILFAPWVELTMTNPEIPAVEARDVMLNSVEGVEFARWWAGAKDLKDPLISPLYADLSGLPPIQIYQGADDILMPDARLLRDRIQAAGGQVEYFETAGSFHVFMGATFTREARAVFTQIAKTLEGTER